jgi:hypothetical protein
MTHNLLFILLADAEVCQDKITQVIDCPRPFPMMLLDHSGSELHCRATYPARQTQNMLHCGPLGPITER